MSDDMPTTGFGSTCIVALIIGVIFACGVFGAIAPNIAKSGSGVAVAQIQAEQAESFEKRASDNQKDEALAGFASNVAIANAGFQSNVAIAWITPATLFLFLSILLVAAYIIHSLKKPKNQAAQPQYYE